MIDNINLFKMIEEIEIVVVRLANGQLVKAKYKELINVQLGKDTNLTLEMCITHQSFGDIYCHVIARTEAVLLR